MTKLYLIPTVISENTEECVITNHVKNVILLIDLFLVENIRTARRYISKLKIGLAIADLQFEILDKHTKLETIAKYFEKAANKNIGIISESGCPSIADPGSEAVALAHQTGIKVIPLSGPSSILMALMASGFNGQSFVFHGYVPVDKKARERKIKDMEQASVQLRQTQVFMDTPYRNQKLFYHLLQVCHPHTLLSVAKGITGDQEIIKTFSIREWKHESVNLHKTPTIFSIFT